MPIIRIFKFVRLVAIFYSLGICLVTLHAEEVRYFIQEFDKNQAFLIFQGDVNSIISSLSIDKRTLRISGIDTEYKSLQSFKPTPLISEIQAIRKGLNQELLFHFGMPTEVKTLPSENYLSFHLTGEGTIKKAPVQNSTEITHEQQLLTLQKRIRELEAQNVAQQAQLEQFKQATPCPTPEPPKVLKPPAHKP